MKTLKKVLTIISCLCFSLAISLNVFGASASTVGGVEVGSFTMENGAWIRVDENSGNGIKFNAFLDTETYDTLEGLENATVNYGMVIVPNDLLPEGGITVDMLKSDANHFVTEEEQGCVCGKTHYAIVEYETLPDNPDADNKILRGSIVNIKTGNVVRPYTAVGYIKYVGDTTEYALAEYVNGDIANSTRSMAYVAQMAIKEGKDADGNIEATYVTPYTTGDYANKFPYTVNHYLNGKDQAPVTEKLYGTLGETVNAKHIASGAMASQYKEYGLYVFGANSTTSSVLYADGKTELNCYYEKVNTVFLDGSADEIEIDTGYDNGGSYTGLAVNNNFNTATETKAIVSYVESMQNGDETVTGITKVQKVDGQSYIKLGLDNNMYKQAVAADWDYIKFRMYVELSNANGEVNATSKNLNFYSWNMPIGTVATNQWVDFIVSKATLNSLYDGTDRAYIYGGGDTVPATSEVFYSKFENCYGYETGSSSNFWWINNVGSTHPIVTYYFDEVSWGIDIDAPELSLGADYSKVYAGNFDPTIVVNDNIVSSVIYTNSYISSAMVTKEVYKLDGENNRTLVTAEDDGTWNLEVGNYVLVATATDKGTIDGDGNVGTQEFEIEVIAEPTRATGYLTDFDIPSETSLLLAKENSGVVPVITYLDEYKGANGVAKYSTSSVTGASYGAYLYFNFTTEMINEIWTAYIDANTDFTFTIRICVVMSKYIDNQWATTNNYDKSVYLYGNAYTEEFEGEVWTDLTFNEDQLASILKWSTTSQTEMKKDLNGSNVIFHMESWALSSTATTVDYYIDSISYSTTPVTAE